MLETIGYEPLELFKCDEHDDVPWTETHKSRSEPVQTRHKHLPVLDTDDDDYDDLCDPYTSWRYV